MKNSLKLVMEAVGRLQKPIFNQMCIVGSRFNNNLIFQYRLGLRTLHSTLTALEDSNDRCCSNMDDIMIIIV